MENTTKIILFAAGFLLTVALIAIGVNVYNKGKTTIDNATVQYDSAMSKYDNAAFTQYDGTTASGAAVLDMIKSLENDTTGVTITVKTGKNTSGEPYTNDGNLQNKIKTAQNKSATNNNYINPSKQFLCAVTKDDNGVVSGVTFTQQ